VNFFEAQDNARRKTWQLIALFVAAVVSLIVLTNMLVAGVVFYSTTAGLADSTSFLDRVKALPLETWAVISVGVVGMVALACLYKYLSLRGGGRAVAEMMGGSLLTHDVATGNAKRLLNIVEEMAIASGIPVPPVYLIPEASINAFAAGLSADDAVIGINAGTIDHLNRDELQGVVAHEFSHIINGDTRINLRLIAALHGITFLSMVGYTIVRGFRFSSGRRSDGNSNVPVIALGIGLLVIGYAGTFFGNLIKAAVSRQREYLADAAAVQFTRNPGGIANALKKIGGLSDGSSMNTAAATEASHMFFGQVRHLFLNPIMATHPPLPKRIKAIEPSWDGSFIFTAATPTTDDRSGSETLISSLQASAAGSQPGTAALSPAQMIDEVGTLTASGLAVAQQLIADTDQRLRDAAHDTWGARGLIYAMLLDRDASRRNRQQDYLQNNAEAGVPEFTGTLADPVAELDESRRLTLVEMAMPALKALSKPQYQRFVRNCITLIKSDQQIDLFEWVLHRLLLKELRPHFEGPSRIESRHRSIAPLHPQVAILLSALARTGHPQDQDGATRAYNAGAEQLALAERYDDQPDPDYQRLNAALAELRLLNPLLKPKLLKACATTVLSDGQVDSAEGALLQGIAATLDCPLPPSSYSQRLKPAG
jgi:Zn-dependent protease with chaperone function